MIYRIRQPKKIGLYEALYLNSGQRLDRVITLQVTVTLTLWVGGVTWGLLPGLLLDVSDLISGSSRRY